MKSTRPSLPSSQFLPIGRWSRDRLTGACVRRIIRESEDPGSVEGVVPGALRERDMGIDEATTEQRSRRAILVGAIGGLAGLVGSRIAWPDEAEAAAGGHMLLGRANSAGTKNTSLATKTTGHALKVTQKGAGTALRGTNTLGTGVSGATGNAAKFGVDAANTAATSGAGAAMHAVGRRESRPDRHEHRDRRQRAPRPATNFGVSGTGGLWRASRSGTGAAGIGAYGSGANYGLYGDGRLLRPVGIGTAYRGLRERPDGLSRDGRHVRRLWQYGERRTAIRVRETAAIRRTRPQRRGPPECEATPGTSAYGARAPPTASTACATASHRYHVRRVRTRPPPSALAASTRQGNMHVSGTLSKTAGSFKIDHPLDPENRWLSHSFVESPDMMNVYNGNAELDDAGKATVKLPAYFEALNRDFRYQLTAVGAARPRPARRRARSTRTPSLSPAAPRARRCRGRSPGSARTTTRRRTRSRSRPTRGHRNGGCASSSRRDPRHDS